jgi:hypothetical protein
MEHIDETPPEGFEPQVDAQPQSPGIYVNPGDIVLDDETIEVDDSAESGDADDGDDDAEDDEE